MDIKPKENGEFIERVIDIPTDLAKPFGRGLRQIISPHMQKINSTINNLEANTGHNKAPITSIEKNIKRITDILNGLEKAKKVEVISFEGGNEFRFSEETEEVQFTQGVVIIDKVITPKFTSALFHTVLNPLSIVLGQAEKIQEEDAKKIVSDESIKITGIIKSFIDAHNIRIVTDPQGNTAITPIRASS